MRPIGLVFLPLIRQLPADFLQGFRLSLLVKLTDENPVTLFADSSRGEAAMMGACEFSVGMKVSFWGFYSLILEAFFYFVNRVFYKFWNV
jgi:hypothetical protein